MESPTPHLTEIDECSDKESKPPSSGEGGEPALDEEEPQSTAPTAPEAQAKHREFQVRESDHEPLMSIMRWLIEARRSHKISSRGGRRRPRAGMTLTAYYTLGYCLTIPREISGRFELNLMKAASKLDVSRSCIYRGLRTLKDLSILSARSKSPLGEIWDCALLLDPIERDLSKLLGSAETADPLQAPNGWARANDARASDAMGDQETFGCARPTDARATVARASVYTNAFDARPSDAFHPNGPLTKSTDARASDTAALNAQLSSSSSSGWLIVWEALERERFEGGESEREARAKQWAEHAQVVLDIVENADHLEATHGFRSSRSAYVNGGLDRFPSGYEVLAAVKRKRQTEAKRQRVQASEQQLTLTPAERALEAEIDAWASRLTPQQMREIRQAHADTQAPEHRGYFLRKLDAPILPGSPAARLMHAFVSGGNNVKDGAPCK